MLTIGAVLSALALLLDTVPPNCQTCFIWMPPIMVAPRRDPGSKSLGARHAAPAAGRQIHHWLRVQQCFWSVTRSESIFVRVSSCAVQEEVYGTNQRMLRAELRVSHPEHFYSPGATAVWSTCNLSEVYNAGIVTSLAFWQTIDSLRTFLNIPFDSRARL